MNKTDYYFVDDYTVLIESNKIKFEYPIDTDFSIQIGQILIVLLKVPFDVIHNDNVFGINLKYGKILWQIKNKYSLKENCPFVGIGLETDKLLLLMNWCSEAVIVNPEDGSILERRFSK